MTTIIDGTSGVTFPAGGVGNPASAVVGLTDTQTLTNKTLTSPTIATPTMTGQATIPTINLTGGQITFPATQSASSNANTLDDYEEGTWTPAQGACVVVGTFSSTGNYTKIGRQVVVTGKLSGSTSISVGVDVLTTGLPFAVVGNDGVGTTTNNAANISVLNDGNASAMYSCGSISATTNIFFSLTYFTS